MSPSKADQTIDNILNAAQQIVIVGKDVLAISPIPGLPVAASALTSLIGMVIQARGNEGIRKDLAENIKTLAVIIDKTRKHAESVASEMGVGSYGWSTNSPELEERVTGLIRRLNDLEIEATKLKQESRTKKFFKSKSNADTLVKLRQGVDNATRNFSLQGQITVEQLLNGVVEELAAKALESLPHVNSRYSSSLNPTTSGVLQGTRTDLLEDMTKWTRGPDLNGNDPLIYVLSGGAGTGKSTLAFEMSRRLDNTNPKSLGASFFFVRDVDRLSTARHVLPTLAYQLAASQPKLRPHLVAAARAYINQGKHGQQLEFDLKELIIEPLKKVASSHHRVVIVMDAIDECQKSAQNDVVQLLYLLMRQIPNLPFQLRVLVTTRPEMHIQKALDSVDFRNILKPFQMQDIPKCIADGDIRLYLQENLRRTSQHILDARPTLIDDLTRHAEGLFIYAATLVHFLEDKPYRPLETLDALLSNNLTDAAFSLGKLDQLYLTVLQHAFSEYDLKSPQIRRNILVVLGSLALVQDRVSANMLKDLTGISIEDTEYVLSRLGSLIHMPRREDGKMAEDVEIQMLHASFPQFIIDKERCDNTKFYINPIEHHSRLASACLSTMTKDSMLAQNICQLDNPFLCMKDIPELPDLVKKHIPAHLQYACVYWATHLKNCEPTSELLDLLEKFVRRKLTQWVEALSYTNRLRDGVIGLIGAYEWWKENVGQGSNEDVPQLMKEAYKLVLEFFSPISIRPLEIYNSAFIFKPHCKIYADTETTTGNHTAVKLVTTWHTTSGTSLHIIEAGNSYVRCVEYSPDGDLIASGSSDGRMQIWDSRVGTLKNTLLGHTEAVRSIAWSPDGNWIVSGSDDRSWRVWNVGSGAEVNQQQVDGVVRRVAWHTNGKQITSAADESGLQVWDVEIGKVVTVVKSYQDIKIVIAISNDWTQALSLAEKFRTLLLWDTEGGTIVMTMKGHMNIVNSAAFLNNAQIVSCGGDDTKVWDIATGHCIHSFKVGSSTLSVSPKRDRVTASGHTSGIIRFWDSQTWQDCGHLLAMEGTWNLSFSPKGERLVSTSRSNLELWDLTQLILEPLPTPPKTLNVIFSPINCSVAIVTKEIITIWSPKPYSGEPSCILRGTFTEFAAFSPDAEKLALIDGDKKICVWSITTTLPTLLYTTSHEFRWKQGIAWSLDGCWIASIRDDNTQACVLEAATGQVVKELAVGLHKFDVLLELSLDSSMIYARRTRKITHGFTDETMSNWREGKAVDVGTFKWETTIDRSEFLEEDGWVIRKKDGKRLCWIPVSRRYRDTFHDEMIAMWQGHNYLGTISDSGQLTLLYVLDDL